MSLDYRLIIDGATDCQAIAERIFPGEVERLDDNNERNLVGDFYATHGWSVNVVAHEQCYVDADAEGKQWQWELEASVAIYFDLDSSQIRLASESAAQAMARILATGPEDCAFVQNADWLLMTRFGGKICKYYQDLWWEFYEVSDLVSS
jgi:hypothetical protein